MQLLRSLLLAGLLWTSGAVVVAVPATPTPPETPPADEVVVAYHRALLHRRDQPDFHYASLEYRWFFPWAEREGLAWLLGTGVGVPEDGFGTYAFTASGGLRRTWPTLVPLIERYFQIDTGVFVTDAHQRQDQRLIGQALEFRTRVALGWHSAPPRTEPSRRHLGWLCEFNYEHISNASLAPRNLGVDDYGVSLGLNWRY